MLSVCLVDNHGDKL